MLWTIIISKMNSAITRNYEAFKAKSFKNASALGTSLDFKFEKLKQKDDEPNSSATLTIRMRIRTGFVWEIHAKNIAKSHLL